VGEYTLHLACDPVDDSDVAGDVTFISGSAQNVTVVNKEKTTADFNL